MTKFKWQGLHIIRIKYWNASGSGSTPSFIPTHWNIGILLDKQDKRRTIMHTTVCLQVRTLFLQWLPWILRMQRPGKPITRKTIMMTNRMRELELKEKTSKSLLANVLDMDDDFRLVSPFSLKKANISERHFLFGWKQKAWAQKLIYIHTTWTVRFAVNLLYSTLLSFHFFYIL